MTLYFQLFLILNIARRFIIQLINTVLLSNERLGTRQKLKLTYMQGILSQHLEAQLIQKMKLSLYSQKCEACIFFRPFCCLKHVHFRILCGDIGTIVFGGGLTGQSYFPFFLLWVLKCPEMFMIRNFESPKVSYYQNPCPEMSMNRNSMSLKVSFVGSTWTVIFHLIP